MVYISNPSKDRWNCDSYVNRLANVLGFSLGMVQRKESLQECKRTKWAKKKWQKQKRFKAAIHTQSTHEGRRIPVGFSQGVEITRNEYHRDLTGDRVEGKSLRACVERKS